MIREEVLGELGLLPLYRRRAQAAPAAVVDAGETAAAVPGDAPAAEPAGLDWPALVAAMETCDVCERHAPQATVVAGQGAVPADCLVVGLAPAASGVPYAGQAGKLLENMLAAIGVDGQNQAYLTTLLKRASSGELDTAWLAHSEAYLVQQLALVAPKALLVLGERPAQYLLDSTAPLAQLRGQSHHYRGLPLVVTHDPSYLLRHGAGKAEAWADLCRLRQALETAG